MGISSTFCKVPPPHQRGGIKKYHTPSEDTSFIIRYPYLTNAVTLNGGMMDDVIHNSYIAGFYICSSVVPIKNIHTF
jgi:hypothetical protein